MSDEQQSKPSFKHAVAKKALAPVVASAATAATTYLMRKGAQVWQETLQPKMQERGGAEALAKEAFEKVSGKVSPVTEAVVSTVGRDEDDVSSDGATSHEDRSEERKQREQRRAKRRRALEQAGSS
jgi:hypothetical protein